MILHKDRPHILIIDDEPNFSESLKLALDDSFDISTASTLNSARDFLSRKSPDAVLIDVRMPDGNGIDFLSEIELSDSGPVVLVMTAYATVNSAVEALKRGAVDYFTKPIDIGKLKRELAVYLENRFLHRRIDDLDRTIKKISPSFITSGVGRMKNILDKVSLIAPLNIPVLISGETGTGKEKLAEWIHSLSGSDGEMVVINCSALPKDIIESELFGHAKGAFSGATSNKEGLIERSDRGTLFLDEIGELPSEVQAKFLRVLESGVYYRVGEAAERKVTFRLISATHMDLSDPSCGFRRDLYFRINGVTFDLPPLHERKEDIPLLVSMFIEQANKAYGKAVRGLSPQAMKSIGTYDWPGNIRELKWAIHRAVAVTLKDIIERDELSIGTDAGNDTAEGYRAGEKLPFLEAKARLEKQYIKDALALAMNNKTEAARMLGISARALHYKITKYKL